MRSVHLFAAALSLVSIVGCSSTTTESPNAKAKPDVMDLNDTPPAPIPPAARETAPAPVAADPAPAPTAGPQKHVVVAKDTLYSLAKQYYGDSKQWPKIVAANPGLVPEKMPVGKTIVIP